jgi:hypothetical protein
VGAPFDRSSEVLCVTDPVVVVVSFPTISAAFATVIDALVIVIAIMIVATVAIGVGGVDVVVFACNGV